MSNFNNNNYEAMISDIVGDAFYSTASYRGKIAEIRKYAEIIVRKLLDYNPNNQMTLGNSKIQELIKALPNGEEIITVINRLKDDSLGNSCSHTQYTDQVTQEDYEKALECLLDLLSHLFIKYFLNHRFGSYPHILYSFSMLPPIIRYKVLSYLYSVEPDNTDVIDKLSLATLKAFDVDTAVNWANSQKEHLSSIVIKPANINIDPSNQELLQVLSSLPVKNMYDICIDKIYKLGHNPIYNSFEEAKNIYLKNGIIKDDTEEAREFNDLMEFVYTGRISKELKLDLPYVVFTPISVQSKE